MTESPTKPRRNRKPADQVDTVEPASNAEALPIDDSEGQPEPTAEAPAAAPPEAGNAVDESKPMSPPIAWGDIAMAIDVANNRYGIRLEAWTRDTFTANAVADVARRTDEAIGPTLVAAAADYLKTPDAAAFIDKQRSRDKLNAKRDTAIARADAAKDEARKLAAAGDIDQAVESQAVERKAREEIALLDTLLKDINNDITGLAPSMRAGQRDHIFGVLRGLQADCMDTVRAKAEAALAAIVEGDPIGAAFAATFSQGYLRHMAERYVSIETL